LQIPCRTSLLEGLGKDLIANTSKKGAYTRVNFTSRLLRLSSRETITHPLPSDEV